MFHCFSPRKKIIYFTLPEPYGVLRKRSHEAYMHLQGCTLHSLGIVFVCSPQTEFIFDFVSNSSQRKIRERKTQNLNSKQCTTDDTLKWLLVICYRPQFCRIPTGLSTSTPTLSLTTPYIELESSAVPHLLLLNLSTFELLAKNPILPLLSWVARLTYAHVIISPTSLIAREIAPCLCSSS